VALAGLAASLLLAACGSTTPSGPPATPTASQTSAATSQALAPTPPIAVPSRASGQSPVAPPSGTAATTRDPSLLAILPSSVAGVPVTEEAQSFGEALADQAFVASVDRAVFLIAVSGNDLASGVVAHLRPGIYSDKMFSDWRSSYDQGACAQSGSVVAHAQVDNPTGTTYVTTCGGGLRVFHTYLAAKGVIVSLFSTGTADLGGQLMSALKG
jgi:hypothetical protein